MHEQLVHNSLLHRDKAQGFILFYLESFGPTIRWSFWFPLHLPSGRAYSAVSGGGKSIGNTSPGPELAALGSASNELIV